MAAALLLFVQFVSAGHFHNFTGTHDAVQVQTSAGSELCPICMVAFHAPAASAPTLTPLAPAFETGRISSAGRIEISRIAFETRFGRAPPVSL
jgi:hypothetical protein